MPHVTEEEYEALLRDRDRVDWLEEEAKDSRTGVTATFLKSAPPDCALDKGFRLMRHHLIFVAKPTLREAIDAAINH